MESLLARQVGLLLGLLVWTWEAGCYSSVFVYLAPQGILTVSFQPHISWFVVRLLHELKRWRGQFTDGIDKGCREAIAVITWVRETIREVVPGRGHLCVLFGLSWETHPGSLLYQFIVLSSHPGYWWSQTVPSQPHLGISMLMGVAEE